MRSLFFCFLLLLTAAAAAAAAPPDAPAAPPAPPAGWKYVEAKDGTYQFLFPASAGRTGTRERTFRSGRLSVRVQANYCVTREGTTLTAEALHIGGAAARGLKPAELLADLIDSNKEGGGDVSPPREVTVGPLPGKEFFVTKAGEVRRVVIVPAGRRAYQFGVSAATKEATTGAGPETFLQSLILVARPAATADETAAKPADPTVKPADPKPGDPKPAAPGGAAAGKAEWTLDPAKMTFPDGPAAGTVRGTAFRYEQATLEIGTLTLRQGKGFHPDGYVSVVLFPKANEPLAGKTYTVGPNPRGTRPHVRIGSMAAGELVPTTEIFLDRYALRLEFGTPANGKVTGKIYLCTSDAAKSVVAGTFEVAVR